MSDSEELKNEPEESQDVACEDQEDFKSKYYYLAAEMDNLRKRHERELELVAKFGNEKLLSSMLEVMDNLERTVSAIAEDEEPKIKNIFIGIDMVQKQFLNILEKNGLQALSTIGQIFDPHFHEALSSQESEDKKDGEIVQEYQKGYLLNGRLLRAAKVVVAKNK